MRVKKVIRALYSRGNPSPPPKTRRATPEWLLLNVIIPRLVDPYSVHGKGGKPGDYLATPPTFVQELFRLVLERVWGYPEGYSPLPPPADPASIPPPPPLPDFS